MMHSARDEFGRRLSALVRSLPSADRRLTELRFGLSDGVSRDLSVVAKLMRLEQADADATNQRAINTLRAYEFSLRWDIERAFGARDEGGTYSDIAEVREALAACEATSTHPDGWLALLTEVLSHAPDWSQPPGRGKNHTTAFTRTLLGVWRALPTRHREAISVRHGLTSGVLRLNDRVGYLVNSRMYWIWQIEADFAQLVAEYDAAFRWAMEASIGAGRATDADERRALIQLLAMSPETSGKPERWLDLFASVSPAIAQRVGSVERYTIRQPREWVVGEPLVAALFWMLQQLTEREREVLSLRYGLDGAVAHSPKRAGDRPRARNRSAGGRAFRTLEQVGRELDVTRERVRQIEAKALKKLKHPPRVRRLKNAIERQLSQLESPTRRYAHDDLLNVLVSWPDAFPCPDRWLSALSAILPNAEELQLAENAIADAHELLRDLLRKNGGSISRSEFAAYLREHGYVPQEVDETCQMLEQADENYIWTDHMIIVSRYIEIARFILRDAGIPLHWKAVYDRALDLGAGRDLNPTGMYNAIQTNDHIFVYRGPGTYGLREWGLERRTYQKDVIVDWFRRAGHNTRPDQIAADLEGTENEIGLASVAWYLHSHPLFFEDLDGSYGLREWLPPPSKQRLDTPRRLRESKRSREQRGPDSGG